MCDVSKQIRSDCRPFVQCARLKLIQCFHPTHTHRRAHRHYHFIIIFNYGAFEAPFVHCRLEKKAIHHDRKYGTQRVFTLFTLEIVCLFARVCWPTQSQSRSEYCCRISFSLEIEFHCSFASNSIFRSHTKAHVAISPFIWCGSMLICFFFLLPFRDNFALVSLCPSSFFSLSSLPQSSQRLKLFFFLVFVSCFVRRNDWKGWPVATQCNV